MAQEHTYSSAVERLLNSLVAKAKNSFSDSQTNISIVRGAPLALGFQRQNLKPIPW